MIRAAYQKFDLVFYNQGRHFHTESEYKEHLQSLSTMWSTSLGKTAYRYIKVNGRIVGVPVVAEPKEDEPYPAGRLFWVTNSYSHFREDPRSTEFQIENGQSGCRAIGEKWVRDREKPWRDALVKDHLKPAMDWVGVRTVDVTELGRDRQWDHPGLKVNRLTAPTGARTGRLSGEKLRKFGR